MAIRKQMMTASISGQGPVRDPGVRKWTCPALLGGFRIPSGTAQQFGSALRAPNVLARYRVLKASRQDLASLIMFLAPLPLHNKYMSGDASLTSTRNSQPFGMGSFFLAYESCTPSCHQMMPLENHDQACW